MTTTIIQLNRFQVTRITKKLSLLINLFFGLCILFQGTGCFAFERIDCCEPVFRGNSEYETKLNNEADKYFYAGMEIQDKNLKEAYLIKALGKYMLLLKLHPDDPVLCTKIGVIHETCHHCPQAKSYFFRAINLENLNPFANFYLGEYYFLQRDYNNAIRYYRVAYQNGHEHSSVLNFRLATLYERLGDIERAKGYYDISEKISPGQGELISKIKSLNSVSYARENYTERTIRE